MTVILFTSSYSFLFRRKEKSKEAKRKEKPDENKRAALAALFAYFIWKILHSVEKIPGLIRDPMALFGFDDTDNLKGTVFPFL